MPDPLGCISSFDQLSPIRSIGVSFRWFSFAQLPRHTGFLNRLPNIVWSGIIVVLFIIALVHAKRRVRDEMERYCEAQGWQFSQNSSRIEEEDWQQLGQNPGLASLSLPRNRRNIIWGTHLGTAFAVFDGIGATSHGGEIGAPTTMIAFSRALDLPTVPSARRRRSAMGKIRDEPMGFPASSTLVAAVDTQRP